jgi:hypothetical protein
MRSRHAWWTASTVGLVLLSLAAPGLAQAAATRHSGTVVAVDRAEGTARGRRRSRVVGRPVHRGSAEVQRVGKRQVATRVTVSELDTR